MCDELHVVVLREPLQATLRIGPTGPRHGQPPLAVSRGRASAAPIAAIRPLGWHGARLRGAYAAVVIEVARLSALALLDAYRDRSLSPVEVVDALSARIVALDPSLGAFRALCLERARGEARRAESAWARGEPGGALCGVPLAVKDLFDSAGVETACGATLLAGRVPAADAEAVRRARAA
jgi:Amidase